MSFERNYLTAVPARKLSNLNAWRHHWVWLKQPTYWAALLAGLVVCCVCLALAYWQWQRAHDKQNRLAAIHRLEQLGNLSLAALAQLEQPADKTGLQVNIEARILPSHYWLWDNKILNGEVGYDVIVLFSPMSTAQASSTHADRQQSQPVYLLNLGWVKAPAYRDQLPSINLPQGPVKITASLFQNYHQQFTLSNDTPSTQWPMRVQKLHPKTLQQAFDTLPPTTLAALSDSGTSNAAVPAPRFQLQLDQIFIANTSIAHAQPHFQAVVMPPEKHLAYMWQWLLLALAAPLIAGYAIKQQLPRARSQ